MINIPFQLVVQLVLPFDLAVFVTSLPDLYHQNVFVAVVDGAVPLHVLEHVLALVPGLELGPEPHVPVLVQQQPQQRHATKLNIYTYIQNFKTLFRQTTSCACDIVHAVDVGIVYKDLC